MNQDFEKMYDKLNSIDRTLAAQHETLKEHIRRTEAVEKALEPIKAHVGAVQTVTQVFLWAFGALLASLGVYWTASKK